MTDYNLSLQQKVLTESIQSDKYVHVLNELFCLGRGWGGGRDR